jgi:GAF domain-containing protein
MTSVLIDDLAERRDTEHSVERLRFAGVGFAGTPVFGPHSEVVGVLAAITLKPRHWLPQDSEILRNHAHLLSEHIMLRAALETIKLMARERSSISAVIRPRN